MTSKQVSAIIEADRNGVFNLSSGTYTAASLKAALVADANKLTGKPMSDSQLQRYRDITAAIAIIDKASPAARCDQCAACMIQGVFCHETGCPNTNSRYEDGVWIKQIKCPECGNNYDADEQCCTDYFETEDEEETCEDCGEPLDECECSDEDEDDSSLSVSDIRDFNGYLANCTDRQVQGVHEKESAAHRSAYVALAEAEASRRGIVL